jgi:DNA-binding transcriptional LysR family regulator
MKISHCSALVATTDTGSFTKAAERLGVTQSAVSHAIAGLEAELGCVLMERRRSGVRLTGAGSAVIEHARAIVAHADQIRRVARDGFTDGQATVRFATSQSFASQVLPAVIGDLRARHPRLVVHLREGTDQQIARWLRLHSVDVGVVTLPKAGISTFPLWRDELRVLLPARHPLAVGRAAVHIRALADEPLLMPIGEVELSVRAAMRLVGRQPSVTHRMYDLSALRALIAEGLGVTVLPTRALGSLPASMRALPLVPAVDRQVALGVSSMATGSSAVDAFVEVARGVAARVGRGPRDQQAGPTPR